MGDVVAHLLDLTHQRFDAVQHQIEVFGDAVPFIMRAAQRYALVQPARHDRGAGGIDRFDPPHGAAGHQDARHRRHHKDQRDDRDDGHPDLRGKAVEIADVPSDQQPVAILQGLQHRPHQRTVRRRRRCQRYAKFGHAKFGCAKFRPSRRRGCLLRPCSMRDRRGDRRDPQSSGRPRVAGADRSAGRALLPRKHPPGLQPRS